MNTEPTHRIKRKIVTPAILLDKKVRTSLCLPETMLNRIHQVMDADGVTRKKRSQWIEYTIEKLVLLPEYEKLVLEEFIEPGGNKTIPISLKKSLKTKIDKTILDLSVLTGRPVEGSSLIRTAISQYLLRKGFR